MSPRLDSALQRFGFPQRRWLDLFFLVVLLAGLVSCSSGEEVALAEQGVATFRHFMDAQQFSAVYDNGSEELRKSISKPDMVRVLSGLNARLGKRKISEKNGWTLNKHTSGTFVTLKFKTQFEKGVGTEQFVFRIADGKAVLVSYNVNSPALIAN